MKSVLNLFSERFSYKRDCKVKRSTSRMKEAQKERSVMDTVQTLNASTDLFRCLKQRFFLPVRGDQHLDEYLSVTCNRVTNNKDHSVIQNT